MPKWQVALGAIAKSMMIKNEYLGDWRRLIVDQNYSPKDAASAVGDSHYEQLKGKKFETYPIYSIRLNQTDRVTFIYPSSNSIKIINIGGHY
ncbi:hypothetical protein [Vibrio campbellii]|uniref:Uncharacterized protein n=1 Tax=Vibrio campbellii (strain ATCC BAA-1116) TaxID=2902295 RepID=A7N2N4_VIBC1|nr:hypothetical protein [Vibrio campbellii]ABU73375.1 hypothetical protein VIBHAR_05471 [Vibrio campbellii ATCC BAA-1116]AGU98716.1 hypothetical protein M892_24110 [Vibrio campbellii ATCC BAA-1116]